MHNTRLHGDGTTRVVSIPYEQPLVQCASITISSCQGLHLYRVCNSVIQFRLSIVAIKFATEVIPYKRNVWIITTLQWHYNDRDGVSDHSRLHCFLNCLFRRRSKNKSKLRVTGLCVGNSPVTGEFPAQKASSGENVSIWWRHHD